MMLGSLLKFCADSVYRLSPKFYYGLRYFAIRKRWPDFKRPTDLSEWLLAQMLLPEFSKYAPFVDKVKVREYVESKKLGDLLPKLYGSWSDSAEIPFDKLPKSFALKANNGCGGHIICADKSTLDYENARSKMRTLLKKRFSIREPHYQYIQPLVYAEEYIGLCKDGVLPVDYKFHCIKGKVNCILTCSNRSLEKHSFDLALFDKDWNVLHDGLKPQHNKVLPPCPANLERMIHIAELLSEDFDFVRVDLYDTGDKVYFGELTFTPASSLLPYFTTMKLREMGQPLVSDSGTQTPGPNKEQ